MSEDRTDLMLEVLKSIQGEISGMKREQTSQGIRLMAIEDHQRGMMTSLHGLMTSIHGVESDISTLKDRVDRIERRLGLMDTEH